MIISHKHKFIFIKTRKTAGTSLEIALSQLAGPTDIITHISPPDEAERRALKYRGRQHEYLPLTKWTLSDWIQLISAGYLPRYDRHMSATEIYQRVGAEVWQSYYKFAFDRNPFDKLVSFYYWRNGPEQYGSLENFVLKAGQLPKIMSYDQYSIKGQVAVDDVWRYEEMDQALAAISHRLGLATSITLPAYKAKSTTRPQSDYRSLYTPDIRTVVETVFARECALLGYKFD